MDVEQKIGLLNDLLLQTIQDVRTLQTEVKKLSASSGTKRPLPLPMETPQNSAKKQKRAHVDLSSDESSSSEDEEADESEEFDDDDEDEEEELCVGDIFNINGDLGVYLGDDAGFGWLYDYDDVPKKWRSKIRKGDLLVSDHDYDKNISTTHKDVTKLAWREKNDTIASIRRDAVYLADLGGSECPIKFIDPEITGTVRGYTCNQAIAALSEEWGCQTHFGMPSKNAETSETIIQDICNEAPGHVPGECTEDVKKPHHGLCEACNLEPKWISHSITIFGTSYRVGSSCLKRIEILLRYAKDWHLDDWHVFLFRMLDTTHQLGQLKIDSNNKFFKN